MNHPALDIAAYTAMKDTMGEIFSDVVQAFLAYLPPQIDKLGAAINQADYENIFNIAHSIKSSSGSIGALGLASTAGQIELLGRNNSTDGAEQQYLILQQQFFEVVDILKHDSDIAHDTFSAP